ncbi:hypothetical protein FOB64_000957 [Candida albicans]|uniref:DUF726-domain-containing protein n=1 Tax=Candida albicans TaxID=5476 RepID=A0A8H6C2R4_CANAX|nr:hypothetical protein FOB64_000957 [Candida albicans]
MSSNRNSFDRPLNYRMSIGESRESIISPTHEGYSKFSSKTSVTHLPSLPYSQATTSPSSLQDNTEEVHGVNDDAYIEITPRVHTSSSISTPIQEHGSEDLVDEKPQTDECILEKPKDEDEDFFKSGSNWKSMKTISDMDYYNEKGELEFNSKSGKDFIYDKNNQFGYTKIDTEEQVNKYAALDQKTDFLFQQDDSDYDEDDEIDSGETLTETKKMLTDSQKFAYIGIAKLITVEMATDLAKVQFGTSSKIAKQMSGSQKNFSNWIEYVMSKLYDHLTVEGAEKEMIENLSKHGVEVNDLAKSLMEVGTKAVISGGNKSFISEDFDLRWVIICDMFLMLLSDGYYDARSRSLLLRFGASVDITNLELFQFERRLIECLDMETKEKSIENKDEKLGDKSFVQQQIKKNKNKRIAYIGLATLAGSLAIGLSAGLLAPVIGAGIAAGFTTIGISGSKAGSRRVGDVHTFEFKPLHNNKRTNLIVTVSGWMNGAMDDVRLPFSTVDPVMGDMFSLLWEPEMLQSMGQTIGILASEALSTSIQQILGATILAALMSAIQIPMALSKLSYLLDNPWNVSLDRAWKAGKILAETIISGNLGVRPITLVGFSLGSRLIYSCLIEMARRGGYGLIENVIILGSPITVDIDQMSEARSVVSGDSSTGIQRKTGYWDNVHGVENIDCTDLVEGHMAYRKAIPKIMKTIGWEVLSEEFAEIEEPDPEQGERQRQLINEFDEARAKMEKEKNENIEPKGWRKWFKPKKKDWWDIYGQPEGTEKNDKGEYVDEKLEGNAVFDVDALVKEVNEIEHMVDENAKKATDPEVKNNKNEEK